MHFSCHSHTKKLVTHAKIARNSKLLHRSIHETKQRAVKNRVLQNKSTQKRGRFCLALKRPSAKITTKQNLPSVLYRYPSERFYCPTLKVFPLHLTAAGPALRLYFRSLVLEGRRDWSYTCQQRCPAALCSHGQTASSYPALPRKKFLFPDPPSPPHASTTILCSVGRASSHQTAVLQGHIITPVCKSQPENRSCATLKDW